MKKYNVNVNGTMYEITVEVADAAEVKSAVSSAAPASAPVAAAAAPAPAAPAPAAPAAAPAPKAAPVLAAGTAGECKFYNVGDREAAMLMAIVANKLGKPLNTLRFKSMKEVI